MGFDKYGKSLTRRDLLIKGGKAALAVGAGLSLDPVLSGCATIGPNETAPVIYPPLRGHKIQPPKDGCMIGFRYLTIETRRIVKSYGEKLGQKPSIFILHWSYKIFSNFPMLSAVEAAIEGVTPFIFVIVSSDLTEIIKGKHDQQITRFAEEATRFGENYGGFIINTMWEMNIDNKNPSFNHPWCRQPESFKKAWKHIWQVFEDNGANEYATWMIEYHADYPLEGYYPGDSFVDWIGLSAYNRTFQQKYRGYRYLNDLISGPYNYFRRRYENKPIMQAEFGTTIGRDQPEWLIKAFQTIKSKPGIKAAIYWDKAAIQLGDDHTLSEESLKTLKQILEDAYFIMAK